MRKVVHSVVVGLVAVHGLIHLMGVAKGFGWAEIEALKDPIGAPLAAVWLLAAVLVLAAAGLLARRAGSWWVAAAVAATVSQGVILTSWSDAKAGTLANLVMAVAAGYGYASGGPRGMRAEYRRRRDTALSTPAAPQAAGPAPGAVTEGVGEEDLTGLPRAVATYVRRSGAVGQPRVRSFHARIHGRIRSGPDTPWMTFTGEQFNSYGPSPDRFFFLDATMAGLPVDVLHVFTDFSATMRAKACSLVPIVDAAGPDMDRGESVTLFNDLCILAPAALVDAPVQWHELDDHRVRGIYTGGAVPVTADLVFDDDGDLVDFVSHDRLRASRDGRSFTPLPWSTPVGNYRTLGQRRVATVGEGRWTAPPPEGEFAYLEFHLDDITYNPCTAAGEVGTATRSSGTANATGHPGEDPAGSTAHRSPAVDGNRR